MFGITANRATCTDIREVIAELWDSRNDCGSRQKGARFFASVAVEGLFQLTVQHP